MPEEWVDTDDLPEDELLEVDPDEDTEDCAVVDIFRARTESLGNETSSR